jgi:hypothetical protein
MSKIGADGNARDRELGEWWEDVFIALAKRKGWEAWAYNRIKGAYFTDDQGNTYTSPDVWILRRGRRQYICEVKHKNRARNGCYGFELARETSMLAIEENYQNQFGGVVALYVVHDHDLSGGKWVGFKDKSLLSQCNTLHWHAQHLIDLAMLGYEGRPVETYYNGEVTGKPVRIKYYPHKYFRPIEYFLDGEK